MNNIDMYAISGFTKVCEVYSGGWNGNDGYTEVAILVPAATGHSSPRYHVIRMNLKKKTIARIGCEVDIHIARACARRPMHRDSKGLTVEERKLGKWTPKVWERKSSNGLSVLIDKNGRFM